MVELHKHYKEQLLDPDVLASFQARRVCTHTHIVLMLCLHAGTVCRCLPDVRCCSSWRKHQDHAACEQ